MPHIVFVTTYLHNSIMKEQLPKARIWPFLSRGLIFAVIQILLKKDELELDFQNFNSEKDNLHLAESSWLTKKVKISWLFVFSMPFVILWATNYLRWVQVPIPQGQGSILKCCLTQNFWPYMARQPLAPRAWIFFKKFFSSNSVFLWYNWP